MKRRISIHALREEGDLRVRLSRHPGKTFLSTPSARRATAALNTNVRSKTFLSTPSARRATLDREPLINVYSISIHALREEGDL